MARFFGLLYLLPYLAIGASRRQIQVSVDVLTPSCEAQARTMNQPVDGWRIITGENGEEVCFRRTVNLSCHAGPQYYHPLSRDASCCDKPSSIVWLDEQAKLGFCGPPGHEWSGSVVEGIGGFCPKGSYMIGDKCESFGHESFRDVPFGLPTDGDLESIVLDMPLD